MRRRFMPSTLATVVLVLLLLLFGGACGQSEQAAPGQTGAAREELPPVAAPAPGAFAVDSVELGSAIDPTSRITEARNTFAPTDTIYAAVETQGAAPSVTLTARWTYEDGQLVDESSRTIAPEGDAVTVFQIVRPSGWPAGRYQVEIAADGRSAATQSFEVR
ncbi:MAG TPA: hypothetical protein VML54_11285 [Candidatus Limnocylindrales bacterium]|nr:hypothetical protein [Candidatus Limnocylindrales bacterium]